MLLIIMDTKQVRSPQHISPTNYYSVGRQAVSHHFDSYQQYRRMGQKYYFTRQLNEAGRSGLDAGLGPALDQSIVAELTLGGKKPFGVCIIRRHELTRDEATSVNKRKRIDKNRLACQSEWVSYQNKKFKQLKQRSPCGDGNLQKTNGDPLALCSALKANRAVSHRRWTVSATIVYFIERIYRPRHHFIHLPNLQTLL